MGRPRTMGHRTVFVGTTVVFVFFLAPSKRWRGATNLCFGILNLKKTNCRHKSAGGRFPTHTNMLQKHCRVPVISRAICSGDRSDHWSIAESCDGLIWWAGGGSELQNTFLKNGGAWTFLLGIWWH